MGEDAFPRRPMPCHGPATERPTVSRPSANMSTSPAIPDADPVEMT